MRWYLAGYSLQRFPTYASQTRPTKKQLGGKLFFVVWREEKKGLWMYGEQDVGHWSAVGAQSVTLWCRTSSFTRYELLLCFLLFKGIQTLCNICVFWGKTQDSGEEMIIDPFGKGNRKGESCFRKSQSHQTLRATPRRRHPSWRLALHEHIQTKPDTSEESCRASTVRRSGQRSQLGASRRPAALNGSQKRSLPSRCVVSRPPSDCRKENIE